MDAQRSLELQDAMPASTALQGYPQLKMDEINRALAAWEKRQGFTRMARPLLGAGWQEAVAEKKKRAVEAKKTATAPIVASKATNEAPRASQARPKAKAERTEDDRLAHNLRVAEYRAENRERVREKARLAAAKRRQQMTPEQAAERLAKQRRWAAERKARRTG